MLFFIYFLIFFGVEAETNYYYTYNGDILNETEYQRFVKEGATQWCTIEVEKCDETEFRRLDGSCNNLLKPTFGAARTPPLRMLPAEFDDGFKTHRKAQCGGPLPNTRKVRTKMLFEGHVPDPKMTQLVPIMWLYFTADTNFPLDTNNMITSPVSCCDDPPELIKIKNPKCLTVKIPVDDPVHRFSGIRCMNLSIPISYQNTGCVANNTVPETRISSSTPLMDHSFLYGIGLNRGNNGLLNYEMHAGNQWPPSGNASINCPVNVLPYETRCHDVPDFATNSLLGFNLGYMWYLRQHNLLAQKLKEINPCWSDDKIYYTAREINIGLETQVFYYEFMPLLMGKENMLKDGILISNPGYREVYDENVFPQLTLEFTYGIRWAHTILDGELKLYDEDGYHYKSFPTVNTTMRTGWLAIDNNIVGLTRGLFRQPSAKANDLIIHPDMGNNAFGYKFRSHDILMLDNIKSRFYGFKPYVDYRKRCSGNTYKSFEDLSDVIDEERIEIMQSTYKHHRDIDLMAGIWMERAVDGGIVPPTLYCILADQLKRLIKSDRHWYERKDRPYAFTEDQLKEIRKASLAGFMCSCGDNITKIQPRPLERPGPGNRIGDCKKVVRPISLEPWRDDSCWSKNYH